MNDTGERRRVRIVVIGGGFAGLFAVRELRRGPFDITLVDQTEHHLFQPLLYQCATGILSEGQITTPLRRVLGRHRNVVCEMAKVTEVDTAARKAKCVRPFGEEIDLDYDHLIVAAGVEQSYFGHDEFATWAPGMKTISDALTIRQRVFASFEMAETAPNPAERSRRLTFALVGAGPTGVELAGQIRELATKTLRDEFRHVRPEDARVLLFDGKTAPLASFGDELSRRAASSLAKLGVEMHMNTRVTKVDGRGLDVLDAEGKDARFDAATVLWTAGVAAPPLATALAEATGAEQDHVGRIVVRDDLTVPGHPEISVVGDTMNLHELPGLAEVAMQSGRYAGRRIRREATGQPTKPFKYRDLGMAAYIARGNAVVSTGPLRLSGFIGWLVWLFIHVTFLTGIRNRVGTILSWWVTFTRDVRRERVFTVRAVGRLPSLYSRANGRSGQSPAREQPPAREP